ncbi:MAG: hypothetical protein ABSB58_00615 [Gemmatimonadales bacterium]|jgi:hypothetical protein
MSSKHRQREARRESRRASGGPSLLRRSRELGGRRFGWPALILVATAFILWLVFDLIGVRF